MKFATLRLLADENLSPGVVAWLRNRGFDVLDVKEQGWQGEDDSTLMERALSEERFVLTYDRDFGYLAINRGQPCHGIVYLRPALLGPTHVIALLERLLDLDRELEPGDLIVVDRNKVRIRRVDSSA